MLSGKDIRTRSQVYAKSTIKTLEQHVRFFQSQHKRNQTLDCNMFRINDKDATTVCEIQYIIS